MTFFSKSKTPTKMFVSHLFAPKSKGDIFQKKSLDITHIRNVVTNKITQIAPELIEEGFKLLSSTIAGFTEDYSNKTVLYKNIDGDINEPIFVPKHITLIRANFNNNFCGDNYGDKESGCHDLDDRKLHIELDIVQSHDAQNFYFQPTYYYYIGMDNKGKRIDEINISFAFVEATENISDYKALKFKQVINLKDLDNNYEYNFKQENGSYDTTFQSPWISTELSKRGAYTIVIEIEEKKYSKPFATKLNKVYKKHEDELKNRINQEIKEQLARISKDKQKENH